jgi:tetratricopeptide (TPR) repeat protein
MPTMTPTRDPESYLTDAQQLFELGKLAQAIEAYQQSIASRPNDPSVYIALARAQVFAGHYKEAQVNAENALLLNPNSSTAYAVRGWALDFQGDFLASESAIKRALEIDPNNPLAHAYYTELLADQYINGLGGLDIVDRMSAESKTALALAPGILESHRARGYVLEVTQNYEDAISEYQAAVAINPNLADLHLALGRTYRLLGVYDKAEASLTRANTLNPPDPTPDYLLSRIYANVGEYGKGEQYAQQAVKDRPSDAGYRGNLGGFYYKNFKYPDAIKELSLVVNGGTTDDGVTVQALDIAATTRAPEYYVTYGLVLAKSNPPQCGEALLIAQRILDKLREDETSVYNANAIIGLCTASAETTPAPVETPAATPTP